MAPRPYLRVMLFLVLAFFYAPLRPTTACHFNPAARRVFPFLSFQLHSAFLPLPSNSLHQTPSLSFTPAPYLSCLPCSLSSPFTCLYLHLISFSLHPFPFPSPHPCLLPSSASLSFPPSSHPFLFPFLFLIPTLPVLLPFLTLLRLSSFSTYLCNLLSLLPGSPFRVPLFICFWSCVVTFFLASFFTSLIFSPSLPHFPSFLYPYLIIFLPIPFSFQLSPFLSPSKCLFPSW